MRGDKTEENGQESSIFGQLRNYYRSVKRYLGHMYHLELNQVIRIEFCKKMARISFDFAIANFKLAESDIPKPMPKNFSSL